MRSGFLRWGIFWIAAFPAAAFSAARIPIAVLHVDLPDLDSVGREDWAKDLGNNLALDSAFLVYDARARNAAALDKAFEGGSTLEDELRARVHGGVIRYGLSVRCHLEDAYREDALLACRFSSTDLKNGETNRDSADFEVGLLRSPTTLKPILTEKLRALLTGGKPPPREQGSTMHLVSAAKPARLIRNQEIRVRGAVDALPLGTTLRTGDMPGCALIKADGYYFVLFPHSSYSQLLPGVLSLNEGILGVVRAGDTATLASQLKSAVLGDRSRELWKTVAQLAAFDSGHQVWNALKKIAALDSPAIVAGHFRPALALDPARPAARALEKLAALDSGILVLRALADISALDSSALMWQGIGRVTGSDTARIWDRLAGIAIPDSNSVWRQIGLLSRHGDALILTPSSVLRGRVDVAQVEQRGNLTRVELPRGEMLVLPVLSAQEPAVLRDLEWGETRGFAAQTGRLSEARGDRVGEKLTQALPHAEQGALAGLLPGKLFARGRGIPTFAPEVQAHFAEVLAEIGAAPDVLRAEPAWPPLGEAPETGSYASGCYLCRPNRLGP